jgi:hypothetical protein
MRILLILWAQLCAWYYRAARDSLARRRPLHPDLPFVVLAADHWQRRLADLWRGAA